MVDVLKNLIRPDQKITWRTFLVLSICYAFFVGIRAPGGWMAHYFQTSWFDGFMRRGLLGSFLYGLGCERLGYFLAVKIIVLTMAAFTAWVFYAAIHFRAEILATLFFLSPAGPYFFHWIGHPEQIVILLTASGVVFIKRKYEILAAIMASLAIMIHEAAVFIILPIFAACLILVDDKTKDSWFRVFAMPIGILWALFRLGDNQRPEVVTKYIEFYKDCGVSLLRPAYLEIYQNSFMSRARLYFEGRHFLFGIIPLYALAQLMVDHWLKQDQWLNRAALILCCLSPLFLGLLGWDVERWLFLAMCQIIFIAIMARYLNPELTLDLSALRYPIVVSLLILFTVRYDFFDGQHPRVLSLKNIKSFPEFIWLQFTTVPEW